MHFTEGKPSEPSKFLGRAQGQALAGHSLWPTGQRVNPEQPAICQLGQLWVPQPVARKSQVEEESTGIAQPLPKGGRPSEGAAQEEPGQP